MCDHDLLEADEADRIICVYRLREGVGLGGGLIIP